MSAEVERRNRSWQSHAVALKRRRNAMPASVRAALKTKRLIGAYRARPAYQRNDISAG
jgi:hypothetical protein